MAFVVSSAFAQGKGEVPDSLFDKAVEFIKRAEGWHRGQMPYIGYGHRLLPGGDIDREPEQGTGRFAAEE